MVKKILVIINPAAGQDVPILKLLHQNIDHKKIKLNIKVTTEKGDTKKFINNENLQEYHAVAIHGGDGTINDAVDTLYDKNKPLIILPGGTANILAKELSVPIDLSQAIRAISDTKVNTRFMDIGLVNKKPFTLRVSTGPLADMILQTSNNLKQKIGQLAYGMTAIQALQNVAKIQYSLIIDGKEISEKGISLIVANSGNIGFHGASFLPSIKVDDGILDIFILKKSDIGYISSIIKEAVIDNSDETIVHYQGKDIKIIMSPNQSTISDDTEIESDTLSIQVLHLQLQVLTPII